MPEEEKLTLEEWHKKMAVDLFNFTWSLLDKDKRTKEEDDTMVHATHASRYHWGERVKMGHGTAANLGRGEWQISRVYAVLKRPEQARYHAQRYLDICKKHGIGDWDLAFAYEALARAAAIGKDTSSRDKYRELAKKAAKQIKEDENRKLVLSDLKTIPGYKS